MIYALMRAGNGRREVKSGVTCHEAHFGVGEHEGKVAMAPPPVGGREMDCEAGKLVN